MINIDSIIKRLIIHGRKMYDENLNRWVAELLYQEESLTLPQMKEIFETILLNVKYKPELDDIDEWYNEHFPGYTSQCHRRHIVYFNNKDYDHRFQCISLFQVLDNLMIVYQRSSDTAKMIDDFRFFIEIRQRYFQDVDGIQIVYGSLHTKIEQQ